MDVSLLLACIGLYLPVFLRLHPELVELLSELRHREDVRLPELVVLRENSGHL